MWILLALDSAAAVRVAAGVESGVHIDPGSPAAKEYALPLSRARQIGAEGASRGSPSGPLFGAGIGPPGAAGSSHSGSGNARAAGRVGGSRADAASAPVRPAAIPSSVLSASSSRTGSAGSGGSILVLLAGGVAILVLGGFGGMILKHSRHSTPTA